MVRFLLLTWRFVTNRWTRYVAAWVAVLALAGYSQWVARHVFDTKPEVAEEKRRRDGNDGHVAIDFGGQWLMGRMLVLGHGHELYDRRFQYEILQNTFPWEREAPQPNKHDSDELMEAFLDTDEMWDEDHFNERDRGPKREARDRATRQSTLAPLMGGNALETAVLTTVVKERHWTPERIAEVSSKHVGGPLYPPIHAFLFAPLALTDNPQEAYFITQWIMLGLGFVAGAGVSALTRGRIWWPVATAMIMVYPGFNGGHHLGQNPSLSLSIIVWGWVLMSRGYQSAGGAVWGLLAFKPTWAAAFLLVPLLTRRWRACLAMIAVGLLIVGATIPFVGIDTWQDWIKVGRLANKIYNVDRNWIWLSRDLFGIPRRPLLDLSDNSVPYAKRDLWYAHVIGWALWLFVIEVTVRLVTLYPHRFRAATGPAAGFILLAGWLSCFHFMYYDALLSALGFLVLLDPPSRIFRPKLVTFQPANGGPGLDAEAIDYFRPRLALTHPGLAGTGTGRTWIANSFLIYFGIILLVVQHTLPYLGMGITVTGRRWPVRASTVQTTIDAGGGKTETAPAPVVDRDGKTVWQTPKMEINTDVAGPPWDTYCLLFLWLWCGVLVVARPPPEAKGIK